MPSLQNLKINEERSKILRKLREGENLQKSEGELGEEQRLLDMNDFINSIIIFRNYEMT